ncbi:DUF4347 domain-containing protein [Undibacterium flavidum]|uniref:DUF4347 domain-containing protein n=1 Tax=Undibacterium flavidum TaxID=2762297 RepID=A0ABR6Y8W0_9BURK|nr:DUF4347 domain-containing protein [Undibacterium flavidum]MBC3873050.1 DUF4347 domain-containing protein [Undibacterium flavidum]
MSIFTPASIEDSRIQSTSANGIAPVTRKEIAFIANNVQDYASLIASLKSNVEVHVLDSTQNALEQIASILAHRGNIDAIHLITHGSNGVIDLGNAQLNTSNLSQYDATLNSIKSSLNNQADVLIYACDVAENTEGLAFIQALSVKLDAEISASNDLTGNQALGGNWILEKSTGAIETASPFDQAKLLSYQFALAAPTIGGTAAGQTVHDIGTIKPFANVTINDADGGATETVTITLDTAAKGVFTAASLTASGFSTSNGGLSYTHAAASPATVQAAIRQLVFDPADNRVATGSTETTTFTIGVNDGNSGVVNNSTTTVISASVDYVQKTFSPAMNGLSVRPGGTSFTWTYSSIFDSGFYDVVAFGWILTRGSFQYSTNGGSTWIDYVDTSKANGNTGPVNFIETAGTTWRYVDHNLTNTPATETVGYTYRATEGGGTTGAGLFLSIDLAPTDISTNNIYVLTNSTTGTAFATLAPTDTGDTNYGLWQIDSQSNANLFTLVSNNNGSNGINTAAVKIGSGTLPAVGQTATLTAHYYDIYQHNSNGTPLAGEGISKQFTFHVVDDQSREFDFSNDINTSTTAANSQLRPTITTLSNGNFVAVWQSDGQGEATGKNGIYAQIYTEAGVAVGSEFAITVAANGTDDITPVVTALGSGRFAVAYTTDGTSTDIAVRFVAANGTIEGEVIANTTVTDAQVTPTITTLSDGNVLVAWVTTETVQEIHAQKFNPTTRAKIGGEITIFTDDPVTPVGVANPTITALAGGEYVTAWGDGNGNVNAVRSAAPSTIISVSTDASAFSVDTGFPLPRITTLTNGSFVIAWDSAANDTVNYLRSDIFFQRFSSAGAKLGSITQANVDPASNSLKYEASIAASSDGGFIITWQSDLGDYDQNGIFARRFNSSGVAAEASEFEINQYRKGDQNSPAVTALSSGKFAVVWVDNDSDGAGNAGIEGRVLLSTATNPAVVTSVSATTADGVYKAGDIIDITIVFDKAVDVTGVPKLTLETGATDRLASYASGTGTNTLHFTYTVQAGDTSADLNYYDASALGLSGGTIKNANDVTDADLDLPATNAAASLGGGKSIEIDTTAPSTTIATASLSADTGISGTDFIANTGTQTIGGTLSANLASGETVEVSVDNGSTWSDASASVGSKAWSINKTLTGSNTIKVKVSDTAGNDGTVYSHSYVIDTTAPTTTIATMGLSDDHGVSTTDFITDTAIQTISGTLSAGIAAGEIVKVSVNNGSTWAIATTTLGSKNWTIDTTIVGSNTIKVSVDDTAGNSGTMASQAYVLDTTAPTKTIASAQFSVDNGVSNSDFITNTANQTISGTLNVNIASGERVEVSIDNGASWSDATTTVGQSSWTIDKTLSGSNTLKVRVSDTAGNSGTTYSQAYVLNTVAPTTTIATAGLSSDTGILSNDFITQTAAQTISGTLSAVLGADELVEVSIDNGATWDDATATVGTKAWTIDKTLSGTDTIKVKVSNTAGNNSTVYSHTYTIDATAPTNTNATMTLSDDYGISLTDFITNTGDQTISGMLSANLAADESVEVSINNGSTWTNATSTTGSKAWTINKTLSGNDTIKVRVTDAAGNNGTAASKAYVIDTTAPTKTIATAQFSADSGVSDSDFITNTANQTISGTLNTTIASGERVEVSINNGSTWVDATTSVGANTWTIDKVLSGSGTLKVRVSDTAGNSGTVYSQAYVLNTNAPTTTIFSTSLSADTGILSNDFITKIAAQTIAGTLSANLAGDEFVEVSINNGSTWTSASSTIGSKNWSIDTTLSGSDTIQVRVTDTAGNSGTVASKAYVIDTTAPTKTIATAMFSDDSGPSDSDFVTNTANQTISGTLNANIASGERVEVSIDNGASWSDATTTVGQSTWTIDKTLSGNSTLKIRVSDTAGNSGTTYSQAYVLNTVAPTTTIATAGLSADTGTLSNDFITKTAGQTISGTLSATLGADEFVEVSIDNGATWNNATATVGTKAWTIDKTLSGTDTIKVVVSNTAGNSGTVLSKAFKIDTTAPTLTMNSNLLSMNGGQTATLTFNFSEDPSSSFSLSDISVSGGSVSALAGTGLQRTATFIPSKSGTASIQVSTGKYTDIAGNDGSGDQVSIEVLNRAPSTSNHTSTINEDVTYTFSTADFNFSDLDSGNTLQSVLVTTLPGAGALTLNSNPVTQNQTISAQDIIAGRLSFTPVANANGTAYANFGFKVSDGESLSNAATWSVNVTAVNDAPTGTVTITGNLNVGQVLTAISTISDQDGMGPITYTWRSGGSLIKGVTDANFTLRSIDVGKTITVNATYIDQQMNIENVSSAATGVVIDNNHAPTGTVNFTGLNKQGETLAATNTLADIDGMGTVSYQWRANGVNIDGATNPTLTLGQAQVGKYISVTAIYLDLLGNTERINSGASPAVINVNDAPTGTVSLIGQAKVGQVLSVNSTVNDLDGMGTVYYRWMADGVNIKGASSSSYTLKTSDVGKQITVKVYYTDLGNTEESVTSAPTAAVVSAGLFAFAGPGSNGGTIPTSIIASSFGANDAHDAYFYGKHFGVLEAASYTPESNIFTANEVAHLVQTDLIGTHHIAEIYF